MRAWLLQNSVISVLNVICSMCHLCRHCRTHQRCVAPKILGPHPSADFEQRPTPASAAVTQSWICCLSTSTVFSTCTTSSDTVLLDRLSHLCTDHMCEYVNQQSTLRVTNRNQSTVTENNSELDQAVYMPFMLQTFSQNLMKMTSRETSRSRVRVSINIILFVIHYLYLVDDATLLSTDPQIALRDRSIAQIRRWRTTIFYIEVAKLFDRPS